MQTSIQFRSHLSICFSTFLFTAALAGSTGCDGNTKPTDAGIVAEGWSNAFDLAEAGSISGIWGSAPNDVFAVGGNEKGSITHFDGNQWSPQNIPDVPLLVWSFGFGSDDVFAVGLGGTILHYDGINWLQLATPTEQDLWGIWGKSNTDLWVVGGSTRPSGVPTLLHYDGETFTSYDLPPAENPKDANAIFKIWGIGEKLFAVGQHGLLLEYTSQQWQARDAGLLADDDFVSLWGKSENHIIAVGGRSNARISTYDGENWTTFAPEGLGGLNAISIYQDQVLVGGVDGSAGLLNETTKEIEFEDTNTRFEIHALWADGTGRFYAVGGNFLPPYRGVALMRN